MPIQHMECPEFRFVCIDLVKMKFPLLKGLNNQQDVQSPTTRFAFHAMEGLQTLKLPPHCY